LERFPALDFILRYGTVGSILIALAAAVAVSWGLWSSLAWGAAIAAVAAGAIVLLVCKAFVELVTLITEMLVPR
jgi:hypothetical protein